MTPLEEINNYLASLRHNPSVSKQELAEIKASFFVASRSQELRCPTCHKPYKLVGYLYKHIQAKHPSTLRYCCKKVFFTEEILQKHNEQYHSDLTNRNKINNETYEISYKSHKDFNHYERIGINKNSPFHCKYCKGWFKSRPIIKEHIRDKHSFTCDTCNIQFKTYIFLQNHCKKQHKKGESYVCDKCGINCHTAVFLARHRALHALDSGFPCKICGEHFELREAMADHVSKVHKPTEQFRCFICSVKFNSKLTFNNHYRMRHPDLNPDTFAKKYGKNSQEEEPRAEAEEVTVKEEVVDILIKEEFIIDEIKREEEEVAEEEEIQARVKEEHVDIE